jgi:predicted dehydrogenase
LIEEGRIGVPYHYWGLSRDQWAPPLDTVKNSGGFAVDTGVHEFDLVRWFFDDEFASVYARGGVFVTKALASLGDYDQVDISFRTVGEKLGLIELSRNAVYGYDVRAEILGDRGAIRVVADHRTTTALYVENQVIGDTFQTFAERFQWAYKQQLVEFVELVKGERPTTPVGSGDAVKAQEVAVAVRQSLASGQPCDLSTVESMSSFQEQIRER